MSRFQQWWQNSKSVQGPYKFQGNLQVKTTRASADASCAYNRFRLDFIRAACPCRGRLGDADYESYLGLNADGFASSTELGSLYKFDMRAYFKVNGFMERDRHMGYEEFTCTVIGAVRPNARYDRCAP